MNLLAWLVLVSLAAFLKRKRECSAELCTCGCTAAPFNYAVPVGGSPEPAEIPQILQAFVPKPIAQAAPPAVGPILAPWVPTDEGGGGTGGGGGGSGDPFGGGGGGTEGGAGGGVWDQWCSPEYCKPIWGNGKNFWQRYNLRQPPGCCDDKDRQA